MSYRTNFVKAWPAVLRARFRVRTLFAIVTTLCVAMGAFAVELQRANKSKRFLERMHRRQIDGNVYFAPPKIFGSSRGVSFAKRVATWLDEPLLFRRATFVRLDGPGVSEELLAEMARSLPCEHLTIDQGRVTDASLMHISQMPSLRSLWLCDLNASANGLAELANAGALERLLIKGDGVCDAMLARIAELKSVRELQLVNANISEIGLEHVAKMPNLRCLFIAATRLSDAQADVIARMQQLERLELCDVGWDDRRMAKLVSLRNLTHLTLFKNPVTTQGIAPLAQLRRLERLDLRTTKVGDESVPVLAKLTSLKSILFDDKNKISPAGRSKLQAALPHCKVALHSPENTPVELNDDWQEFIDSSLVILGNGEKSLRLIENPF